MLVVTATQMAAIEVGLQQRRHAEAIAYLGQEHPAWSAGRSPEAIDRACRRILALAWEFELDAWSSIRDLLDLLAAGRFPLELSKWQRFVLSSPGVLESNRVARFLESTEPEPEAQTPHTGAAHSDEWVPARRRSAHGTGLVMISLDTDLSEYNGWR